MLKVVDYLPDRRTDRNILSTARGFKKIAGKGEGVEYLFIMFYSPRGHVQ